MFVKQITQNLYHFAENAKKLGFIEGEDLPDSITELTDAAALTRYLIDIVDNPVPDDSPLLGQKSAILYFFSLVNGVYELLWDGYSEVVEIPQCNQIGINETNSERRLIEDVASVFIEYFFK